MVEWSNLSNNEHYNLRKLLSNLCFLSELYGTDISCYNGNGESNPTSTNDRGEWTANLL